MKKIDWVKKLTSRKFWLAVCGLVSGIVIAITGSESVAATVSGIVMSTGSVIAYIIGEGMTDSANKTVTTEENEDKNNDSSKSE